MAGVLSCDDEINPNDVTVRGTVFKSPGDSGIVVDIMQLGSPMYRLSPRINNIPAQNLNQSERYIVDSGVLSVDYDSLYFLEVVVGDAIIADTVKVPGNFRIYAESDTLIYRMGTNPTVSWSRSDSVSSYFVELWYTNNAGNVYLLRQVNLNQDTVFTLPRLDALGFFRVDVYAYLNGVYHPNRGYLTPYDTPDWWTVHGSWNAWVRRTIVYLVP